MTDKKLLDRIASLSPEQREKLLKQIQKQKAASEQQASQKAIQARVRETNVLDLSFAQQRLWFLDQLQQGSAQYNIVGAVRMKGALNAEALRLAFEKIVGRHESLRTTFISEDGQGKQVIHPALNWHVPLLDLSSLDLAAQEREVKALLSQFGKTPFDLQRGPLLRTELLKLSVNEHVLMVNMHHIISDGWSMGVLIREMAAFYDAAVNSQHAALPELKIQYADFALWQREHLQGETLEKQIHYWRGRLAGAPVLELPTDRPRAPVQTYNGTLFPVRLGADLTRALNELSKSQGVTLYMTLLSALNVLLSKYSGQDDICIGSPIANRTRSEVEPLIGCFVNTLVLRSDLSGNPSFSELLKQVQAHTLAAYQNQDVPFEKLVDSLGLARNMSRSPLFQVMFSLQNTPRQAQLALTGVNLEVISVDSGTSKFDLTFNLTEQNACLEGEIEFNTDLFNEGSIARLWTHFEVALRALVANPALRLSDIPLLTEAELKQQLVEWNSAASQTFFNASSIHALFEAQAAQHPEKVAVQYEEQQLSYGELNRRANRLAHYLIAQGIERNQLIGLSLNRSLDMLVGILGILKAGAAYVPVDPNNPPERSEFILGDAGVSIVVAQSQVKEKLPAGQFSVLCLDEAQSELARFSDQNPQVGSLPDDRAYVIYTSGTTGKPKGVLIPHRNVVRLFSATDSWYRFDDKDVWTLFHSFAFDFSVWEIWGALTRGGRLIIVPHWISRSPEDFYNLLIKEQVTVLNQTPSAFTQLIKVDAAAHEEDSQKLALRYVIFGGEALDFAALQTWQKRHALDKPCLINMYGITETTVHVTYYKVSAQDLKGRASIIGRPIPDQPVYVLDKFRKPVPVGVAGELYVGGQGNAHGYLYRPELTDERFVANPFADSQPGNTDNTYQYGKLYKTGDVARYLPNGDLEYLGRADDQVKIRGFRIELGEIETAITQFEQVRESCVLAREDEPGNKRLVAYIATAAANETAEIQAQFLGDLRNHLKTQLPEYMVPAAFVVMDSLPLTGNGKIDKRALPAPDSQNQITTEFVAPRTQKEKVLAEIWCSVLNLEKVGVTHNFFELGGDSILSIQIIARAKRAGLHISAKDIFENQTVAELALVASDAGVQVLAEQGDVKGEALLTPIQHWFFNLQLASPQHYNQSVLLKVADWLLPDFLSAALEKLIEQHDALRLSFLHANSSWTQNHTAVARQRVQVRDLSHVPDAQLEPTFREQVNEIQAGFKLADAPLVKAVFIRLGGERGNRLLLVLHHLVVDGVSWRILLEDLLNLLNAQREGKSARLGNKSTSYQQWAKTLYEYAQSENVSREFEYWQALTDKSHAQLPLENAEGENSVRRQFSVVESLSDEETTLLLRDAGRAYRTEINDLLLTALARVIARWTAERNVLIEMEGHGREEIAENIDISRTVGWFTTIYPVLLNADPNDEISYSIKAVKEQLRGIPHRGLHYGLLKYLSEDLKIRTALAKVKQAPILFNYLGQFDAVLDGNDIFGLAAEFRGEEHARTNARSHLLDINAVVSGGCLQLHWNFSIDCFETDTISSLAALYVDELRHIIAHCVRPGVIGFTPSDFPLAKLTQQQLDDLLASKILGRLDKLEALYPLSPTQEGVLFHSLFDQAKTVYFEQFSVELLGAGIDEKLFADAWQQTINRHAILRTGFVWEDLPRPLQYVQRDVPLTLIQLDWRESLPYPELSERENLTILMQQDAASGFDLKRPGLMRVHWVLLGENRYRMIWSFHHLLIDGWSLPVVLGDVFNIYNAKCQGLQPALTRAPKFEDFIAWLAKQDKAERDAYWKNYLDGFSAPTDISIRKPISKIQSADSHYDEVKLLLNESTTAALQSFARDHHLTLNTLVQGAWGIVLSRYSREKDVVFGVTVSGRPAELADVENTVGMFINTLPMRVKTDSDENVVQWLQQMQASQIETRRFESTPLVEIHRQTSVPGEQQLFDSILVFENYPVDEELRNRNPLVTIGDITTFEHTNYPLTFIVGPAKELTLRISYDTAQFEADSLRRALGHVKSLLEEMLLKSSESVQQLSMLGAAERKQLIEDWNQTDADYPSDRPTHELFEAQAEISPQATAILYRDQSISYGTLNAEANRLAHYLQTLGAKNKDNIAICMDRSIEMVTGLLAIMKTGGAYVALDPSYPVERLIHMVEDTAAPIIITHSRLVGAIEPVVASVPQKVRMVVLDLEQDQISGLSAKNLNLKVNAEQLAHIVFTSGSTGKPKGVMIQHFGLTRLCFNTNYISVTPADRISHASNVSFDASTFELWGPLLNGASMVILDKDTLLSPDDLAAEVRNKKISILFLTTALVHYFAQHNMDVFRGPRVVMFGGEACDLKLIKRVFDEASPDNLINLYGPSENSAYTSFYKINEIRDDQVSIPIGKPVSNTRVYILDERGEPCPIGVPGELYCGGMGVVPGYLNRADLTEKVFLKDPFDADPAARMYKTGDLCRYLADGNIEYIGRIDNQVKIRGFRIELGEIESAIAAMPSVVENVVSVREDEPGQKRLVAYVVLAAGTPALDAGEWRVQLKRRLPDYMVPTAYVQLPSMPLTPNGKIDKKTLPAPADEEVGLLTFVGPRNATEQTLADIWSEVLNVKQVGVFDNFFELGGDSILSIQIISRAKRAGIQLSAKQIFENPTIAELAVVAGSEVTEVLAEQGLVSGDLPLTPVQRWFFDLNACNPQHFNQSLLLKVDARIEPALLEKALDAVYLQHDGLRVGYEAGSGYHCEPVLIKIEKVDLRGMDEAVQRTQLEHFAQQLQASFDLRKGNLIRAGWVDLAPSEKRLLLVVHHLVVDVFSWRILLGDLQTALRQLMAGEEIELGSKSTSFKQWAEYLQTYALSNEVQQQTEYWKQQLLADVDGVVPEFNSTAASYDSVRTLTQSLSTSLTTTLLQEASKAYRTEINDLLLSALMRALNAWQGISSVRIKMEAHGREPIASSLDVSRTVGWFTTLYPVVLQGCADKSIGVTIKSVKEQLRAVPQKGFSYGLLRYLTNHLPTALEPQITFNYLGQLDTVLADDALFAAASEAIGSEVAADFPRQQLLDVNCRVQEGQLQFGLSYSIQQFSQESIERLLQLVTDQLAGIVDHCGVGEPLGVTPSDFPLAQLDQHQLDMLVQQIGLAQLENLYPLSPVQEGMLFHSLYQPGSWVYFDQLNIELLQGADIALMQAAWDAVVARHAILRTGFVHENLPAPLQFVVKNASVNIVRHDLSALPMTQAEQQLSKWLEADRDCGFKFDNACVMRLNWFDLPDSTSRLIWSFHHVLLDGWSMPLVLGDVFGVYNALAAGSRAELPAAPNYSNYIDWLCAQDKVAQEAFWRNYLSGFSATTPLPIKLSRPRGNERYHEAAEILSGSTLAAMYQLAREHHLTLNTIVQGAFAIVLARYAGEQDIVFGATVAGRPAELNGVEKIAGLFINTLPVRVRAEGDAEILSWLTQLQAQQADVRRFESSSLADIQRLSELPNKAPLFETIVVFENYPLNEALESQTSALKIGRVDAFEQTNFPLTLIVTPGKQEMTLRLSYDQRWFEDAAVERMLGHLRTVLNGLVRAPSAFIKDLCLVTAAEYDQVVYDFNKTASKFAEEMPIHRIFEAQVQRAPDAIAVEFPEAQLSYAQLNEQANQLAHYLRTLGVENGKYVGICLERSIAMVVGTLAILKAGGAYVPLDPSYPEERLAYMLQDTRTPVLITNSQFEERLWKIIESMEQAPALVCLEKDAVVINQQPALNLDEVQVKSDDLAYVIYTSGSTGKPKGVMVPHVAVTRLVINTNYVQITPTDRMGHISNVSFDAATFEFWGALLNGARLVGIDKDTVLSATEFPRILKEKGVSVMFITVALFNFMTRHNIKAFEHMRVLSVGGEALDPKQIREVVQHGKPVHLLNGYGPTENTTFSTWYDIVDVAEGATSIPIGYPLANSTCYILDEYGHPAPIGVPGELYCGGLGVARGYLNRPDLNAEKFLADEFSRTPGARMYRTGDIARWLPDGAIEVAGRRDDQVKIRGFRIELGEIENALESIAAVSDAVVIVKEVTPGDKRLLAYLILKPGSQLLAADIRAELKKRMPEYLVPSALTIMDAFPFTPNGKVDKRALPEPDYDAQIDQTYVAPRDEVEIKLAGLWADVLNQPRVGAFDDFFELGGHSLLATRVHTRLREHFGIELPLRTMFEVTKLNEFAELIKSLQFQKNLASEELEAFDDEDMEEGTL